MCIRDSLNLVSSCQHDEDEYVSDSKLATFDKCLTGNLQIEMCIRDSSWDLFGALSSRRQQMSAVLHSTNRRDRRTVIFSGLPGLCSSQVPGRLMCFFAESYRQWHIGCKSENSALSHQNESALIMNSGTSRRVLTFVVVGISLFCFVGILSAVEKI